jgi:Spy/CpxP family protein refolding chaperone
VEAQMFRNLVAVVLFSVAGLCLIFPASQAQDKKPDDTKKAKGYLPPGWKNLDLTATQKDQIYKIQTDYKTKIKDLEQQIKELKGQESLEMTKVLTDAQKKEPSKNLGLDIPSKTDPKIEDKKDTKSDDKKDK